jgi:hypothetical protein
MLLSFFFSHPGIHVLHACMIGLIRHAQENILPCLFHRIGLRLDIKPIAQSVGCLMHPLQLKMSVAK